MRWKTTWLLVLAAAVLFAFIYLVERHSAGSASSGQALPPLLQFNPADITAIQLRRTNQFVFKVERTNQSWSIISPISYAAQGLIIDHLLKALSELSSQGSIALKDLNEQKRSIAEFGLDIPAATLVLFTQERRVVELMFGAKTPVGDRVYVQIMNSPDIYTVNAELFDHLPLSTHQWRDIALVNLDGLNADRMEVRASARSYTLIRTNNGYVLTKPTSARADASRADELLRKIQQEPVRQFVSDDPRIELEPLGLQPPLAEVVFGAGTNDLLVVQFGNSPANGLVYARRVMNTNIVLVSSNLLDALLVAPSDLRDPRLLAFSPTAVDMIEVNGPEKFTLLNHGSNRWEVAGSPPFPADADLVRDWLNHLSFLEGTLEKDVVSDFGMYGLLPPFRQYILKSSYTNPAGIVTDRVVAQLDLSTRQQEKIFAHSGDKSVYWIKPGDLEVVPTAAWQLRDRRVWSFSTNQVSRVTIRQQGYTRQLLRKGNAKWELERGSQGMIEPYRIEEAIYLLGELRAAWWVDRSGANRLLYGFKEDGYQISIELKNGEKPQILTLEFGELAPNHFPYALATKDGQSMVFEFPLKLFLEIVKTLSNPPVRTSAALEK